MLAAVDMTLRPAVPDDAEAIAEIWHLGWRDGHLGNVPDALVAVRTRASFDERARLRVGDTTVAVVAGAPARVAMVVHAEGEQVYLAARPPRPSARHRGTGVATALLAEAERRIAANGHARAWLAVAPGNARARRFYERCGWADEGAFEYLATGSGQPVPVLCCRYVKPVSRR